MLHLNPGIYLNKIDIFFFVQQKLHSPGIVVAHCMSQFERVFVELFFGAFFADANAGRDFDHLLKAALNRTVAFVQVHNVAVAVTQDLYFDVFGAFNEFFQKEGAISKSRQSLTTSFFVFFHQRFIVADNAHASATTTSCSLDNDGITNAARFGQGDLGGTEVEFTIGDEWDASLACDVFCGNFIAQLVHNFWIRADKSDSSIAAGPGEIYIFR